ncbi:MAG: proteasome accessory factor PafA2 family protein, partial [Planctomycetota bacterium]
RLYVDTGHHPEFCTPEVDNPDDWVAYAFACEAILRDLARQLSARAKTRVVVFKCNVDYTKRKTTWACHESYEHEARAAALPRQLIPHFVTRLYCAAGGLRASCPGIEFTLSPRVHTFVSEISSGTTGSRGIFNTREEALAGRGHQRLHVICCDSVCSHTSLWLRGATTGLVLAMTEAGLGPGDAVQLRDPLQAMHSFAIDPHFTTTAELVNGRRLTALEIQRHYLERAEAHLDHDCMPPWAEAACRRWREMLDRLKRGPEAVQHTLDWAIKYPIFMDHLRRGGVDPEALPHWNKVVTHLHDALRRGDGRRRLAADLILDPQGPLHDDVRRLGPYLKEHGLHWEQVGDVLRLRAELCEIDMLFGQVEPEGIFHDLEPHLDHRIIDDARITEAKSTPPQTTRARLRGEAIVSLAGKDRCCAGWTFVRDGRRRLDLSDPLESDAHWETVSERPDAVGLAHYQTAISREYNRGNLGRAHGHLEVALRLGAELGARGLDLLRPYQAWVESRRGRLDEAIAVLDDMAGTAGGPDALAAEYVAVHRFQGLTPAHPEARTRIDRADQLMARERWSSAIVATYLGHKGYILARAGPLEEAERVLRSACAPRVLASAHRRVAARSMADLADVLRIKGEREDATTWLDKAEQIYEHHEYPGEEADYLLTYRAKLAGDLRAARAL